jgi:transposase-like protein
MEQHLSILKIMERIPDEASAYKFLEDMRWGDDLAGQVCPKCGVIGPHYFLTPKDGTAARKTRTGAASQRRVWKCKACRTQFSVLTGTIFHGSKVPVRTWVFVIFELVSNNNGISAREIERRYDLTPKTAWFVLHRLREAMKRDPFSSMFSGTVVADETWIGGNPKNRHAKVRRPGKGSTDKTPVLSLINVDTGEVRSQVVPNVTGQTLGAVLRQEVDLAATVLHTDEAGGYYHVGFEAAAHERVSHRAGEYVNGRGATTNAAEGYLSQLKRSIDGTHHHVSVEHPPCYLAEFDFRYSTRKLPDTERMSKLMGQVGGRRLTYRPLAGQ